MVIKNDQYGSMSISEALILAGGKGTRLQDSVKDRPKPLAVVAGRPFIEWLLIMLHSQGIRRVVICTGHMGKMIESHLGDGSRFDLDLVYVSDPFPLGTGGALRNALSSLNSASPLVLNGDSYFRIDVKRLSDFHFLRQAQATILLANVQDSSRFGSVAADADGKVTAFHEKTSDNHPAWINAGVYLVNRDIIGSIPTNRAVSLEREVFPGLIGHGLYAKSEDGLFWDIGTVESYESSTRVLSNEFEHFKLLQRTMSRDNRKSL
jgi:NDP-sugar pyrophosphorylase family protein